MNYENIFLKLKEDLFSKGYIKERLKKSKNNNKIFYLGTKNYNEIWNFINSNPEYKEYIAFAEIKNLSEILILIRDNLFLPPRCPYCGNKCKFEQRPPLRFLKTCGSKECHQKEIEATNLKRRGVKNPMHSSEVKETLYQNNLKRTGYKLPLQNPEIFNEMLKKNISNWGVPFPSQVPEFKEKQEKTCIEKYGVKNYALTQECKEKIINHNREVWGADYPQQSKQYRESYDGSEKARKSFEKRRATIKERYGVDEVLQVPEFRKKAFQKYQYDGLKFDSSWELIYYIYQRDHGIILEREPEDIPYLDENDKIHKYYPDFKIITENQLVEIKGDHFFDEQGNLKSVWDNENTLLSYKQKCMEENNVIVLKGEDIRKMKNYVNKTYGRKFVKSCKIKKKEENGK